MKTHEAQRATDPRNVTLALLIATFLSAIDGTIVSTAMPRIVSDLGGIQLISWVVSVYLLTTTVSTPIYGKLADLFGRKPVFFVGAIVFLAGSMLSGLSQTMGQLIGFRALQGLGAGALLPITYTIVGDIYPFEQRARVQGWISGVWGVAGLVGPLVGGLLVDHASWRWVFYLNLPFGVAALLVLAASLHEEIAKTRRQIDYWGALTFTISMSCLLYALTQGGTTYPWSSPVILGLFGVTAALLAVFLGIEARSPEPMMPLRLFTLPTISLSNLSSALVSAVVVALSFYLPLWIQGVHGRGATYSGLALAPMSVTWSLGSIAAGQVLPRIGIRSTALLGVAITVLGSAGVALLAVSTPAWLLIALIAVLGAGFGLIFTSFTVAVQSGVGRDLRGAALASNTFVRALGQTIGIAAFGTVLNTGIARYLAEHSAGVNLSGLGADLNEIFNPERAQSFPAALVASLRDALASSLHEVFVALLVISAVALVVTVWLPRGKGAPAEAGD
ncbi:MAG TPA: MDR family MFS transporter [Thermomicrobiales bacterium]|nr:MDR family MFS transporter [Thermomicrobiales bacterium]